MNLGELFVQIGAIGNSKEVKAFGAAVKKAGQAIDNYDKKLKNSRQSGNKLTGSIKGTIGAIVGIAGAVAAAYYALDRLTDSLAKNNLQWLNLTRQSDIALSTFQKWGTIGKIVGVDNAAQQLENLNQKIFNLRLTGEGAKGFQMAGIMPTNAEDVLEQLRGRIAGMSNTSATYLLQQMGLDPKMITLLRMGREEWEQYLEVQKRYTLNKDQRESIDKMNRQLEVARIKWQYLKNRAILAIMPAFVQIVQSITRMAVGFSKLVNKISKGIKVIADLRIGCQRLGGIIKFSLIPALIALGAVFAPIQTVILAVLSSWYLLIDDFLTFKEGGRSVLGVILALFEDISDKINFESPQWIKDLLLIVQNLSNLTSLPQKIKNQEPVDLSQGVKEMGTFMLPLPFVGGVNGLMLRNGWNWWQEHNPFDKGQDNLSFDSAMSPFARQTINNTENNTPTTIAMNNTFYTNQPAQDITNDLRYLQAQFA